MQMLASHSIRNNSAESKGNHCTALLRSLAAGTPVVTPLGLKPSFKDQRQSIVDALTHHIHQYQSLLPMLLTTLFPFLIVSRLCCVTSEAPDRLGDEEAEAQQ